MAEYRWMKTDTASIMFSALTTKNWGRTFRFSAQMDAPVQPEALQRAAADVFPHYPNMCASLRRGFFWTYQTVCDALPRIRPEAARPLLPITSRDRRRPDLRLVYGENEISLESSHCVGDGKGIMRVFEELLTRYVQLYDGADAPYAPFQTPEETIENAFDTYYEKGGEKAADSSGKAFHFAECYEPDYIRLQFAEMNEQKILELSHARNMTVTQYLCAVLILGVIRSSDAPITQPVTVAVPVNLRRFFETKSLRNFTIQTYVTFDPAGRKDWTPDEICAATEGKLQQTLTRENLQRTLNKYGALKYNPVLRAVPYALKRPVLKKKQRDSHAAVTTILTNLGDCPLPKALEGRVKRLRFVNGDTRSIGLAVTVSCVSAGGVLSLCFSHANRDTRWFDACVSILRAEGVEIAIETAQGTGKPETPCAQKEKTPFTLEKLKAYFNI